MLELRVPSWNFEVDGLEPALTFVDHLLFKGERCVQLMFEF